MRRLLFIPLPVVALLVSFGLSAVGQGHAQSPARHAAQGTTITVSWTLTTGQGVAVATNGQLSYIGTDQAKMSDGSTASDSFAGINYAPAANGCSAQAYHFTHTTTTPTDAYDGEAVAVGCPVPGHANQSKDSANFVITGGSGRYKGAIGSGTNTTTATLVPTKAAGQYAFKEDSGQGTATITLAGQ